jgi:putative acetyltransferase
MSAVQLRPYLPSDAARCADIFRASIEELASEDYSLEQCAAWAARADDLADFAKRLGAALTLIALVEGEPAGLASLKGADAIDMIYVDPRFARRGVGTALLDALIKLATARGAKTIAADVSDTARPLFERLGFQAQRRNLVELDQEWLANTTMTKSSAPASAASALMKDRR